MTILKHRIDTLRLRADAPFPSQAEDAQDAIRQWRHEQLVRRLDGGNGSSDPDYCDDLDLQGEIE
jgi:hypothetical protein